VCQLIIININYDDDEQRKMGTAMLKQMVGHISINQLYPILFHDTFLKPGIPGYFNTYIRSLHMNLA